MVLVDYFITSVNKLQLSLCFSQFHFLLPLLLIQNLSIKIFLPNLADFLQK